METVTTKHSIKAFCLLCKKHITYSTGNGNFVYRHVERYHKKELEDVNNKRKELTITSDESKAVAKEMKLKEGSVSDYFPTQKLMKASMQDQLKGEALFVKWVAEDLRPFKIVEDRGILDFSNIMPFKIGFPNAVSKENQESADEVGGARDDVHQTIFGRTNGILQSYNRHLVIQSDAKRSCFDPKLSNR
jgi:hypothetical protein